MTQSRKIVIGAIVIAIGIGVWYWLQGIEHVDPPEQPTFVELPLVVSDLGGDSLQEGDLISIVLTLNCQLSSLDPGCGADQLYASLGSCDWESDAMRLVNHKVFNSGYEEAQWIVRLWENGPLWLTTAHHLQSTCSESAQNKRKFVGTVSISFGIDD